MKISTFMIMLVMIGVILFVMVETVNEGAQIYDTNINSTEWENRFDYVDDINSTVSPIQESLKDLADEETGWLEKIGASFTGIIAAVKLLPTTMISLGVFGAGLITGLGSTFGIPSYIIYALIVGLTVWGVFKLFEIFQRWQT